MSDQQNGQGQGQGGNAGDGQGNGANQNGSDEMVSIKKSEMDNFHKSRDEERELRKNAEARVRELEAAEEKRQKDAETKKSEEKGEFDKVKANLESENQTLKARADRLDALEKKASDKNQEDLKLFKDKDELELVKSAIEGKDPLDTRDIIKKFKAKFLVKKDEKAKDGKDFGGGHDQNPDSVENKKTELAKFEEEMAKLRDKKKNSGFLSPHEEDRVRELSREMTKLKSELNK